jgi:hypothetical protein
MNEYMCYLELLVGAVGLVYGFRSESKRSTEREWIHVALVNIKPAIQGENQAGAIAAINNMLEFVKPPKNKR